jgi:hypothetical protein
VCNRALRFQEFAQNGVAPSVYLERNREGTQLKTRGIGKGEKGDKGMWNKVEKHGDLWSKKGRKNKKPETIK